MNRFRHLRSARRGVAAVEFALVLPFILLAMLGTADLVIFLRTKIKLDETAVELGFTVTQYTQLYDSDFPVLFNASQVIAGTTPVTGTFGATIISCVYNAGSGPVIAWQQRTGAPGFKSQIGSAGGTPKLPDAYTVVANQMLIVTEIYTSATAFVFSVGFMGTSGPGALYAYSLQVPRTTAPIYNITSGNRPS